MSSRVNRGGDRYDRDGRSAASGSSRDKRPTLNEYWIDGDGINRQVLQSEICKYLGAEATCRPGDYNGRPGYKIRAMRPFTPEMVDDLKVASRDYLMENRALRGSYRDEIPYEESETRKRQDPTLAEARYSVSPSLSYNIATTQSVSSPYSEGSTAGYSGMPSSMYGSGSGYQPGVTYSMAPSLSAMNSHVPPSDSRYQQPSSNNYTYGQPSRETSYPSGYGYQPSGYPGEPPRSREVPAGYGYASTSGQDPRMRQDPYYDTQMGGIEPSQPAHYGGQPRHPQGYGGQQSSMSSRDYPRQPTNDGYGRR